MAAVAAAVLVLAGHRVQSTYEYECVSSPHSGRDIMFMYRRTTSVSEYIIMSHNTLNSSSARQLVAFYNNKSHGFSSSPALPASRLEMSCLRYSLYSD